MMLTGLAITLITGSLLGFGAYALLRASARARMTPYSLSSFTFYRPSSKEKSKTNEASHLQDSILQEPSLYISLVAPAYNEESRIGTMLQVTLRYLENRCKNDANFTYEIIVVDDGSRDGTCRVVKEFMDRYNNINGRGEVVRLLPLGVNRGKGFAVKQGMIRTRGQLALMLDSDGATDIADLGKLEQALRQVETADGLGIALGSRAHYEDTDMVKRERSFFRNLLMHIFHYLVAVVGGIWDIRDTQCGFKLFTREAVREVFPNLNVDRWCFDIEMIRVAHYLSIPLAEVAVNWKEIEGSKLTVWGMAQTGKDVFLIRLYHELGLWSVRKNRKIGTRS